MAGAADVGCAAAAHLAARRQHHGRRDRWLARAGCCHLQTYLDFTCDSSLLCCPVDPRSRCGMTVRGVIGVFLDAGAATAAAGSSNAGAGSGQGRWLLAPPAGSWRRSLTPARVHCWLRHHVVHKCHQARVGCQRRSDGLDPVGVCVLQMSGSERQGQMPAASAEAADRRQQTPTAAAPVPTAAASADPFGDLLGDFSGAAAQPQPGPAAAAPPAAEPRADPAAEVGANDRTDRADGVAWVPLQLALGLPLAPEPLNELVCKSATVSALPASLHDRPAIPGGSPSAPNTQWPSKTTCVPWLCSLHQQIVFLHASCIHQWGHRP